MKKEQVKAGVEKWWEIVKKEKFPEIEKLPEQPRELAKKLLFLAI